MYNKHDLEHAKQRPGYVNWSFIPWMADPLNPAPTRERQETVMQVLKVHRGQMKAMKLIPLQGVIDIHRYIQVEVNNEIESVTLERILMCMRTKTYWKAPLIMQVGEDCKGNLFICFCTSTAIP